jgi:IS605 OrfB family transposase
MTKTTEYSIDNLSTEEIELLDLREEDGSLNTELIVADIKPEGRALGIDRGINNLAVSSDNQFYSGGQVKRVANRYRKLRQSLQKKGTKSAKRHLKKLSGQERRFKADINHQISKQIVSSLQPGDIIVLENLTGIRNKRLRKPQRTMINGWNFYQLEEFLVYKAQAKGITVEYINPRYTSQHCLACGNTQRNNRNGSHFECSNCHFTFNADLVGAKNIVLKYLGALLRKGSKPDGQAEISKCQPRRALVNEPIVSISPCGEMRDKPTASAVGY